MSGGVERTRDIGRYLDPVTIEEKGKDAFRATGTIAADCSVLRGHFPGRPVLPGAFHVWMALLILREVTGTRLRLLGIRKAKFRKLLTPGDAVTIQCSSSPEGSDRVKARCTVDKEGKEASRFTMIVGPARP